MVGIGANIIKVNINKRDDKCFESFDGTYRFLCFEQSRIERSLK